jgi:hypothetical protein
MSRSTSTRSQIVRVSQVKRLKELQQENDFLKLLYSDLLQKFSAMKEGLTRSARVC